MIARILFAVATSTVLIPIQTEAGTIPASSCSYTDVASAYDAASAGDTVTIPAGSCTWSSTLTISKALTLKGAGSNSTIITSNTSGRLVVIQASTDIPIRVTGLGFNLGSTDNGKRAMHIINTSTNGTAVALKQIRIDNNAITGGGRYAVEFRGKIWGVFDHNTCTNVNVCVFTTGNSHYLWVGSWGDPSSASSPGPKAGTSNALFIEDNTFLMTGPSTVAYDAPTYYQEGPIVVTRYNTFQSTIASPNFMTLALNDHANQNYGIYPPYRNDLRGLPLHEFYNNTLSATRSHVMLGIRGGSFLIHNNTITCTSCGAIIQFSEEEAWQTAFFSPLRSVWPAQDQIHNTFIWNNTVNGSPLTSIDWDDDCGTGGVKCSVFIQQNRDYFMRAPQASGGREYFSGRPGGSSAPPTSSDGGTMIFTSSGANQYYPYTPFTYPHPLTQTVESTATTAPPAPTNLTVLP